MYGRYCLTLMVTHRCNMRCGYCYNGEHIDRAMSLAVGRKAIERAVRSVEEGGRLVLGFFGGEPFLEAGLILELMAYSRRATEAAGMGLGFTATTNGTVTSELAWSIMVDPQMDLAISLDGRGATHDVNRCFISGEGTSRKVLETIKKLQKAGKQFRVVTVVRPEGVGELDSELRFLRELGINEVELSLDVWSEWDGAAMARLEKAIIDCGQLWSEELGEFRLNWFDDKAALLAEGGLSLLSRCGFGKGEIAVSPAGNLYPCERLIGEDAAENPMLMTGDVFSGEDFLLGAARDNRTAEACRECEIRSLCNTVCGCCNYARTGSTGEPDGLLCMLNQWCLREVQSILKDKIISY